MSRPDLAALSYRQRNAFLYEEASFSGRFVNVNRPLICPLEPVLESVPAGAHVLDVGCGCGMMLLNLAIEGRIASGLGVEISAGAVADARRASGQLQKAGVPAVPRFELREPGQVLQHEERYDAVLLIDVLHHVPPPIQDAFVEQVFTLVAPGGTLVYKDMCRKPLWRACGNRLHDLLLARQWIHYYARERVRETALAKGWSIKREAAYTRLWYGHELTVLCAPV